MRCPHPLHARGELLRYPLNHCISSPNVEDVHVANYHFLRCTSPTAVEAKHNGHMECSFLQDHYDPQGLRWRLVGPCT